jgi:hypothetical protein
MELRVCPRVLWKRNAQQVEIDNRSQTARQVRKELTNLTVMTDQLDRPEQRLNARLVARGVNAADDASWSHGITRGLTGDPRRQRSGY